MAKRPRVRFAPEVRRAMIVETALKLSVKKGLFGWNRNDLVHSASVPTSFDTTKRYFMVLDDLRIAVCAHPQCSKEIVAEAVRMGWNVSKHIDVEDHGKAR